MQTCNGMYCNCLQKKEVYSLDIQMTSVSLPTMSNGMVSRCTQIEIIEENIYQSGG